MLKKVAVIFFALILGCMIYLQNQKSVFSNFDGKITFYTLDSSSNATMVKSNSSLFLFSITGESIEIENSLSVQQILDEFDAKILFIEKLDGGVSYYAYSKKLKYQTTFSGEKINLHFHLSEGRTVIGTPLIFGSF